MTKKEGCFNCLCYNPNPKKNDCQLWLKLKQDPYKYKCESYNLIRNDDSGNDTYNLEQKIAAIETKKRCKRTAFVRQKLATHQLREHDEREKIDSLRETIESHSKFRQHHIFGKRSISKKIVENTDYLLSMAIRRRAYLYFIKAENFNDYQNTNNTYAALMTEEEFKKHQPILKDMVIRFLVDQKIPSSSDLKRIGSYIGSNVYSVYAQRIRDGKRKITKEYGVNGNNVISYFYHELMEDVLEKRGPRNCSECGKPLLGRSHQQYHKGCSDIVRQRKYRLKNK